MTVIIVKLRQGEYPKREVEGQLMSSPVEAGLFEEAEALQEQFEALEIPSNIDPRLLALWTQREEEEIERRRRKYVKPPTKNGRKLDRLFAAYIGIAVMCLSIVLGLVQGLDPTIILETACIVFLVYIVIGFFVGTIAERCVDDSVESLLREIVKRSRDAGSQTIEPEHVTSASAMTE